MRLDERLFLAESVQNIDGIYFTHSYIDLGLLLRKNNIEGQLIRTVGFPEQKLYGMTPRQDLIHYNIYRVAKDNGIIGQFSQEKECIHFYSIYDTDIEQKLAEAEKVCEDPEFDWLEDDSAYTSFLGQTRDYRLSNDGDLLLGYDLWSWAGNSRDNQIKQKQLIDRFYNI